MSFGASPGSSARAPAVDGMIGPIESAARRQPEGRIVGVDTLAAVARRLLAERRAREVFFPRELLGEPVWDILLHVFAAEEEGSCVTVGHACAASGVPSTTALRQISTMEKAGLLERTPSTSDKRVSYLRLTSVARIKMVQLLVRLSWG